MERSSRFLSLSGLSGIAAGLTALIGSGVAFFYLGHDDRYFDSNAYFQNKLYGDMQDGTGFLVTDALIVLFLALGSVIYFTTRKARRNNTKVWNNTSKRLLINVFIPLAAGGVFCIALLINGIFFLIAPATLVFYGLALVHASKYTLPDVRMLGFAEIITGLAASFLVGYGLLFWAFGFGVLHILYGVIMYYKYEWKTNPV
ncbi:MAG: hypothetical protein JW973_16065 [Bacteroidales bacterium]|nr:hypothetical protein [Bacteroidales bacterium]